MKKCVIFTGGEITDLSFINCKEISECYVICADAGCVYAGQLGIKINLAVGDFDSLTVLPQDCDELVKLSVHKDDTDTMYACRLALERGYTDIDIYGALGGRFDHTYANIQTLTFISTHGGIGRIVSDHDVLSVISEGSHKIPRHENWSLSLFAITDSCEGVTIEGCEYPLEKATVFTDFPIGMSNRILAENAVVSLEKGRLLLIESEYCNLF